MHLKLFSRQDFFSRPALAKIDKNNFQHLLKLDKKQVFLSQKLLFRQRFFNSTSFWPKRLAIMCSENFEMCSENFQMCSENFQILSDTEPLVQVANHKEAGSDDTLLI